MYNSIQQFNEFGVRKIEKEIETFVAEKKDLVDLVLDIQESLFELGRNIVAEVSGVGDTGVGDISQLPPTSLKNTRCFAEFGSTGPLFLKQTMDMYFLNW